MVGGKHLNLNSRTRHYYDRMCKKVRSTTNIESLPDELLSEILVRVPADDLYDRARLVCWGWYNMIRSHAFVNAHLEQCSTDYGLMLSYDGGSLIYVSVTKQVQIEISKLGLCRSSSSCNGLVLGQRQCSRSRPHVGSFILNPATKQAFDVSLFDGKSQYLLVCDVAYAATSMVYKVVRPVFSRHPTILSLGVDTSWRPVPHSPSASNAKIYTQLITEGYVHWAWLNGKLKKKVLTMNVETEIITETYVRLPRTYSQRCVYYLSTGRYLTLLVSLDDIVWNVWEMKPAESGEWKEQSYNIKFETQQLQQLVECDCNGPDHNKYKLWPVGWVKYPEILAFGVRCSGTYIFYNLRTHQIYTTTGLPSSFDIYHAFPHRNTLVRFS